PLSPATRSSQRSGLYRPNRLLRAPRRSRKHPGLVLDADEVGQTGWPRVREGAVGVDLDHRHAGALIDVLDGEHELAACTDFHLIARLHGGAFSDRQDRRRRVLFPSPTLDFSEANFLGP